MAVQIASVLCLMVVIAVMLWVLMVEAPRKVASPRTEQWRQRSWAGAPVTPQTPPDPEPPMPPDPPPPPDQCAPWALDVEAERLLDVVIAYRNAMHDGADYFCPECRFAAEIVGHDDDCPIGMAMDRLLDSTRAAIEAGERVEGE